MKRLPPLFALLLFLPALAWAQEARPAEENSPTFWEKIRTKIEQITPTQKPAVTTAVGGVRGERMASDELYWRGEQDGDLSAEEVEAFSKGLHHAEKQEREPAIAAFKDFLRRYPQSSLADDARQALRHLETETAAK